MYVLAVWSILNCFNDLLIRLVIQDVIEGLTITHLQLSLGALSFHGRLSGKNYAVAVPFTNPANAKGHFIESF